MPPIVSLPLVGSSLTASAAHLRGSDLRGSANGILGSSFRGRTQDPHKISYPDGWRKGPTEEWYKSQQVTTFTSLQYRKERQSPFCHEYVVLEMATGDMVCLLERRGDLNDRVAAFSPGGIPAEDTAHFISKDDKVFYPNIEKDSDLLLTIHFPQGQDLLTVLGICYGIQSDESSRAYRLMSFNCYFFSWTIVIATARRTVDWAIIGKDDTQWGSLVESTISALSEEPGPIGKAHKGIWIFRVAKFRSKRKSRACVSARSAITPAPSSADLRPFNGTVHLVSALRHALINARNSIRQSLTELVLRSTVQGIIHDVAYEVAHAAAEHNARLYAHQAASDIAMEGVIETMWRAMLDVEGSQGVDMWEERCHATRECVYRASLAAANTFNRRRTNVTSGEISPASGTSPVSVSGSPASASQSTAQVDPTAPTTAIHWATAWDHVWAESWATLVAAQGKSTNSEASGNAISARAKQAWYAAWTEATRASDLYVPRIGSRVAQYITERLPDSSPEELEIDVRIESSIQTVTKSVAPEGPNTRLQEWVQQRIREHCDRIAKLNLGLNRVDPAMLEDTMRRIWAATTKLDFQPI